MKFVFILFVGMCCLLWESCKTQPRKADPYPDYISTLFQYETNLQHMAMNGGTFWTDIFKDAQIPLDRKMDLVNRINEIAQPNEQMAQRVKEIAKQDVPRPTPEDEDYNYTNWKYLVLLGRARSRHAFHEAFLLFNYIDEKLLYSELEGVGDLEIAILYDLTALYGELEWSAILTDKKVDVGLKAGLIVEIHDKARYGEY